MLEPRHLAAERVDFRRNAIEIATALGLLARFFASTRSGIDGSGRCVRATSATPPLLSCIVLPETEIYVMLFVNGDH
jgi:hypothetical protein